MLKNFFLTIKRQKTVCFNKIKTYCLKRKMKNGKKIKVCFEVIFDSVFPAESLYQKMLEDKTFEPFILVIPDKSRGSENMFKTMDKTYFSLSAKYKNNVLISYDDKKKKFIDFSKKMDIVCSANPYDGMTNKLYSIKYLATKKNILAVFCNYFYFGKLLQELDVISLNEYSLFWLVFAENNISKSYIKKYSKLSNNQICVSGYLKMDQLYKYNVPLNKERKKIIIAPHHTINNIMSNIALSNFLIYSEFFIDIAKKYTNIDFIFRPHPLLFINLEKYWKKEEIENYIAKIHEIPNLVYQNGGDYLESFAESDALIHDCGSFLAEYFYTNKPQCYLLRTDKLLSDNFTENGIKMLENVYTAKNKGEIISFIDNVVINQNDVMYQKRIIYAKQNITINYPNSAEVALNAIKQKILKGVFND